jgi:capsular exopolysaccharide synthesis family protein
VTDQARIGPTLIESLWRHRTVVVGTALLLGILGYLVGGRQAPSYDATAELFLRDPTTTPGVETRTTYIDPQEYVPQQAARARSRAVLDGAALALGDDVDAGDLRDVVAIDPNPEDLSLTVTATADTAEGAAAIANAVGAAFMELNESLEQDVADAAVLGIEQQLLEREAQLRELEEQLSDDPGNLALQSQVQNLSSRIIELETTVSGVKVDAALRGSGVAQFERALPPAEPARPQPRVTAISFAFLGGVIAAVWAYWYAGKSQRVLSRGEPEAVLGVPLLGEIPLYRMADDDPLAGLLRIDPAAAEAYEFVLSSIEFALGEMGGSSLLVTSTLPGDGKTTTSLQLAIAASRDRRRVVLVDADIRARGLTTVLGAQDRSGLSDLASLDLQVADVMRRYRFSEQSQIPVVTAGQRRGDPAALLRTTAFRRAVSSIKDSAELLIIDASPLLAVADATIVAASADGMVLVVSHGTPVSELQKVRERMKFVSTPLLGYIFNRSDAATATAYGYGYGVATDEDGQRRLVPRRTRPGGLRRRAVGGDAA